MLVLATWNVKDLFDGPGLERKLDLIGRTLGELDADVVALQEIGCEEGLARAAARAGYRAPMFATPDARGIRNAALVRGDVAVRGFQVHTAPHLEFPSFEAGDPPPFGARIPLRRGVLHVELDARARGIDGVVHLFVVHFKSSRPVPRPGPASGRARAEGELLALVWRSAEALHVRGLVDDVLARDPSAHVVVAGDYNDGPASVVVSVVSDDGALVSAADRVDEAARYTVLVDGNKRLIDHILVSRGLAARLGRVRIVNAGLRDHSLFPSHEAPPSDLPDSDHAPLVVEL